MPQLAFCSSCGARLEEDTRFCGNCGSPTNGATFRNSPSATAQHHPARADALKRKSHILRNATIGVFLLIILLIAAGFLNSHNMSQLSSGQGGPGIAQNTAIGNAFFIKQTVLPYGTSLPIKLTSGQEVTIPARSAISHTVISYVNGNTSVEVGLQFNDSNAAPNVPLGGIVLDMYGSNHQLLANATVSSSEYDLGYIMLYVPNINATGTFTFVISNNNPTSVQARETGYDWKGAAYSPVSGITMGQESLNSICQMVCPTSP